MRTMSPKVTKCSRLIPDRSPVLLLEDIRIAYINCCPKIFRYSHIHPEIPNSNKHPILCFILIMMLKKHSTNNSIQLVPNYAIQVFTPAYVWVFHFFPFAICHRKLPELVNQPTSQTLQNKNKYNHSYCSIYVTYKLI